MTSSKFGKRIVDWPLSSISSSARFASSMPIPRRLNDRAAETDCTSARLSPGLRATTPGEPKGTGSRTRLRPSCANCSFNDDFIEVHLPQERVRDHPQGSCAKPVYSALPLHVDCRSHQCLPLEARLTHEQDSSAWSRDLDGNHGVVAEVVNRLEADVRRRPHYRSSYRAGRHLQIVEANTSGVRRPDERPTIAVRLRVQRRPNSRSMSASFSST